MSSSVAWKRAIDLANFPIFGRIDFEFRNWLTDVEEPPEGKVAVLVCDGVGRVQNREIDLGALGMPGNPSATVHDLTVRGRFTIKFPLDMGLATQVNGDLLVEGSMTIRAMGETGKSTMRMASKQTYTLQAK